MQNSSSATKESPKNDWVLNLISLLFFTGVAWWRYSKIIRFEAHGGCLSLPKPITLFYDVMNKWGVHYE
jgi:hypothetical protein